MNQSKLVRHLIVTNKLKMKIKVVRNGQFHPGLQKLNPINDEKLLWIVCKCKNVTI